MANVIILIHGLGNKPPERLLKHWWKRAMIEGLRKSNYNTLLPTVEMVYWADLIYDFPLNKRERDKNNPYYIDEKYTRASLNIRNSTYKTRKKVITYLNQKLKRNFLNNDFSLNYAQLTDAIISKYFKELKIYYSEEYTSKDSSSRKTKDLIRGRLLTILEKYKYDNIMLISHSMGTIIAYDVLNFLAQNIKINTFITMGSPLGLPIVLSKIFEEQKQKKSTENIIKTPPGVVNNWYNFSDILDTVAFDYQLGDDFYENNHGVKPKDFLVTNNYEMNGLSNPHKSYGYLRTPEFSAILNQFILTEEPSFVQKIGIITRMIIDSVKNRLSISDKEADIANT